MFGENRTVSHGTLRTTDLLQSFASEAESVADNNPDLDHEQSKALRDLANEAYALIENGNADSETGSEVVGELQDALSSAAPEGWWFGTHPGDGSDFGYWPVEDFD
jgi:methyl-accepting chemotaxis protein